MKKFLSLALALLMAAVLLPTTALADTAVSPCVAKIGDTGYDSLDNAIKAAANKADPTTINLEPGVTFICHLVLQTKVPPAMLKLLAIIRRRWML